MHYKAAGYGRSKNGLCRAASTERNTVRGLRETEKADQGIRGYQEEYRQSALKRKSEQGAFNS